MLLFLEGLAHFLDLRGRISLDFSDLIFVVTDDAFILLDNLYVLFLNFSRRVKLLLNLISFLLLLRLLLDLLILILFKVNQRVLKHLSVLFELRYLDVVLLVHLSEFQEHLLH